jgi:tripeptidyl-peptidase I|eukprot:4309358-Prymnesium_polylepis.1
MTTQPTCPLHRRRPAYAVRSNAEFAKAAARGISLLAAAGDSGAGCATTGYVPTFPASSPWITAVGGLQGGADGAASEEVWPPGGGGFSNYYARPAYQEAAVSAFFNKGQLPSQHLWNRTGAGFPDISAHAMDFDVCTSGFFYPVAGTSAASPTAAGIFATLNQLRVDAGKPKLGFLNPLIYQNADAFTDITSGTNDYCDSPEAFSAVAGWDAASGVGSPNFAKLKKVVLAL